MDTEPNPGTSSVSTTTSSTTTTTITTSSSRMQQPQISVYSGSDRHAVQELYSLGYET
ncbi:PHC3 isoform 13 [Pan troglodytes]|uniref:Polyhomeotic homolog 3 n=6 Tax=Hominidae TaxID=9604 RepID=F8WDA4_HUMAN|nr:polyhomeotic-like 3 [Homo sapiens]KAI4032488.1 polyhomeotic homolog 3 [Homo sapiens]PNI77882.1 PHC3 isoform 13 [Pan troglodytes]PNJ32829.1 PHC3 isoform 12 [Pongo abelii]